MSAKKKKFLKTDIPPTPPFRDPGDLPRHVAIIMDGNGRWARRRGLPRVLGHRFGVESVREVIWTTAELGIPYLSLFTFSTENWQRPPQEVRFLMRLLTRLLYAEVENLKRKGVRLHTLGKEETLPEEVQEALAHVRRETREGDRLQLYLALSYGGRLEILEAVRGIARKVARGELTPDAIDEETFRAHLLAPELPDVDLLIRTSGEYRISNFLLWQIPYAELYITEIFWPDFRREAYLEALAAYARRERRFGTVPEGA